MIILHIHKYKSSTVDSYIYAFLLKFEPADNSVGDVFMHQIGIYPDIEHITITEFVLLWFSVVSICTYLKWNVINWLNGEEIYFFFSEVWWQ